MNRRFGTACALSMLVVLALWPAGHIAAQSSRSSAPPRTPWGDPDLQGYYTNKYEYGTPFERPAAFAGRRLDDISGKELAELVAKRQQETLDRAPFFGGDPEGKIGNSAEFRDIYEVTRGSRAWFVTDPADGRIPSLVPDARARVADLSQRSQQDYHSTDLRQSQPSSHVPDLCAWIDRPVR